MAPAKESLSMVRLTRLISTPEIPAATLAENMADYEAEACMLYTEDAEADLVKLLSLFYSSFLISLILVDDLDEARFLTHRVPLRLKEKPSLFDECKRLLQVVWSRQYSLVCPSITETSWPNEIQALMRRYLEHYRTSMFYLLSRAYRSMPLQLAAPYLGLQVGSDEGDDSSTDSVAVAEALVGRGWHWDVSKQLLLPASSKAKPCSTQSNSGALEGDMTRLVGLVGFLGE